MHSPSPGPVSYRRVWELRDERVTEQLGWKRSSTLLQPLFVGKGLGMSIWACETLIQLGWGKS